MIALALPLALLALPLPLVLRLLPPRDSTEAALALPSGISRTARPAAMAGGRGQRWAMAALWLCLCLALAQPERIEMRPDQSATGRDIIMALDMSGSMEIKDFSLDGEVVSRLAAVKSVAQSFIAARQGDRMGLVIFGDRAYVASPLSHDLAAVSRALDEAEIGLTGRSTAISDGIGLALKRILASEARARVIILFSDGRDTAARIDPRAVARFAADQGVRIHSVALGPEDLETRPTARDAVDLAALREIAQTSGGEIFRVKTTAELAAMAAALDQIEPNPSRRPPVAVPAPLWPYPAGLALLILAVIIWRGRR